MNEFIGKVDDLVLLIRVALNIHVSNKSEQIHRIKTNS